MFALLLAMLITTPPAALAATAPTQDQLFEEANGWRVLKTGDGCVAFFKQPGLSVSLFYPKARDVLTMIVHHAEVPALPETNQAVLIRVGRAQWGPIEAKAYRGDSGLPGIIFGAKRGKALAEFGRATEIGITKRFSPPRTIPLVAADKAADMLGRCVG